MQHFGFQRCCALLAICACLATTAVGQTKRNVLLLVSDNQSWPDCGCYGNSDVRTPGIDRLASDGVKFNYGFATTASCGPSRAVLYTGLLTPANGQYGHGHGVHTFVLNPKTETIFTRLRKKGYHTALLGKQHTVPKEQYPFTYNPKLNSRDVMRMAEAGKQFIQQAKAAEKPFFLTMGYSDPHPTSRNAPGWGIRKDFAGITPEEYDSRKIGVPSYLPDKPWVREGLAGYYQLISRMDAGVNRMLDVLEETGTASETLVIFTSDHGSSEPGAMANHYEPGVRVPFIVRNPRKKNRGTECNAMVTLADIVPTIVDWTNTARDTDHYDGRSFLSAMNQEYPAGWDEVFLSHVCHEVTMYYPMRTLRTRRYKLIWNIAWRLEFPNPIDTLSRQTWIRTIDDGEKTIGPRTVKQFLFRDELELYNLQNDPDEIHNLAAMPEHAAVRDKLLARLKQRCHATPDPWLDRHQLPSGDSFGRHATIARKDSK